MSGYTPTDGEVLTAVVLYRAIASVDAPPPTIETIATPEETARYLGEYQRWLAAHDAKARAEALREAYADLQAYTDSGAPFGHRPVEEFLLHRADRIEREAGLK